MMTRCAHCNDFNVAHGCKCEQRVANDTTKRDEALAELVKEAQGMGAYDVKPEAKREEVLLPCPFCGGKAEYDNDVGPNDEGFWEWIGCTKCGARANNLTAWNRRADDKLREVLEEFQYWALHQPYKLGYDSLEKITQIINAKLEGKHGN